LATITPERGVRCRPVGSYVLYHRLRGNDVQILRIVHAARDARALRLDG
jgi:plasmid stabilization system protein ParE